MSRYIPYYSSALYQAMKTRTADTNMRTVLRSILVNSHVAEPGQMDRIVAKCAPDNKICYQHTPLGYERARLFLMGYFYLVQTAGNQYAIKEAYCNKLYGPEEFRSKSQMPRPQFIPDNTVINVEHTWPQSRFTGQHPTDTQKSDLHHLYPTDSKLNAIRGNYPFGEVETDSSVLKCGQSRFGQSRTIRGPVFEPPDVHKGHVARALFYFAVRYDLTIDAAQEATLRSWHQQFPVDSEELLRNDEIHKAQGNRNPFIDHPELVASMRDF
ncbi:MAG: endonuclease [Bdellovibrionaceae bacterium]|nr:endonuclease [Pseudobdellovibrionaceae bacterium]